MERALQFAPAERKVMQEAEEAKLLDGMAIPLHGPCGEVAGVGLASSTGKLDLNPDTISTINLLAHQFHNAYTVLEYRQMGEFSPPPPALTKREREVLLWCAQGKTDLFSRAKGGSLILYVKLGQALMDERNIRTNGRDTGRHQHTTGRAGP
jgi:hypothetical protein